MRVCYKILLILFFIVPKNSSCQVYKFWIGFADKNNSTFSISRPNEFLSQKAIERRYTQGILVTTHDLPVSLAYIDSVESLGFDVLYSLKWFNGLVVQLDDTNLLIQVQKLSMVNDVVKLYDPTFLKSTTEKFINLEIANGLSEQISYGASEKQIKLEKGDFLHELGYLGEGMLIAILDAGFYKADVFLPFKTLFEENRILATRDFVNPGNNVYNEHVHGMGVLSIIGTNMPDEYVGTAPEANFCLIRTEDVSSESIIEEYNWCAGAEFADSIGVDIINSSLGYYNFDDASQDYNYAQLDGNTTLVTRAADFAASKGILVVNSAGNEGGKAWRNIIAPSDGDSVICTGALTLEGDKADFSSFGPRIDNVVKPDVMAAGADVLVCNGMGDFVKGNGTSYAAPIITGLAACLWQAFPQASNMDIFNAITQTASQFLSPDSSFGNGIADFGKAYFSINGTSSIGSNESMYINIYPNPFNNYIRILVNNDSIIVNCEISLFNLNGQLVFHDVKNINQSFYVININNLNNLNPSMYFLQVKNNSETIVYKIIKR